jgi:hypothetical protein
VSAQQVFSSGEKSASQTGHFFLTDGNSPVFGETFAQSLKMGVKPPAKAEAGWRKDQ